MQNKLNYVLLVASMLIFSISVPAAAQVMTETEDISEEINNTEEPDLSSMAVAAYDVNGSLFQQITDLEQEKVLMQLEKERAQLNLELDKLEAEKIKLRMEIDSLSGRAEQQQEELENTKAQLEAEAARLQSEKEALENKAESLTSQMQYAKNYGNENGELNLSGNYKLVNVIGVGPQLYATVEDLVTGQNKKISVGKKLDGYSVKSISLDEGVTFVNSEGDIQTLGISTSK